MPLASLIRTIPDYPRPGVQFRDLTPLLQDAQGFAQAIGELSGRYRDRGIAKVAGIESRGFILGAPLALALGTGFVPLRKAGRLPAATYGLDYATEYSRDRLEVHQDAFVPGERILLADDLLATGGTAVAVAAATLIEQTGASVVECAFLIELPALGGRRRLTEAHRPVFSLIEMGN